MVCLDTDLLVGLLREDRRAVEKIKELEEMQISMHVTPITACELFKGAYRSNKKNNIEIVRDLLNNLKLLELDVRCAQNFGKISAELKNTGAPIGELDALIGATCLTHGHLLITKNTKHFEKIEGLVVQGW